MTEGKPLLNRRFSRRSFMAGAGGAGTLFAAPAIVSSAAQAQQNVVYVNSYGGSYTAAQQAAYFAPFTKATGIEVRPVTPVSAAKIKAQVTTGNYEWDCCEIGAAEFEEARRGGFLEPIDRSIVELGKLLPQNVYKDVGFRNVALSYLYAYRSDRYPNGGPTSWADFWNVEKFPGKRALSSRSWTNLSQALLADGVPLDKLYPLDLDRAFKKLDQLKPHIKVWWTENSQAQQLISDGEVDMIGMANARAQELVDRGLPVGIVWNGGENYWSHWFVSKGTPRAKAAWTFLNFIMQAQPMADFCKVMTYGPSNPDAFKVIDATIAAKLPTSPEHLAQSFSPDVEWLGERLPAIKERWAQWIAS